MKLLQIEGFHRVDGVSAMPGVAQHGLYPSWDNDLGYFVYKSIKGSDDETFVNNTTFADGVLTITRNDGVEWVINLEEHFALDLPGDTMILFDENDTIGGRSNLTYNYTSHQVILKDTQGLYAQVTSIDGAPSNVLQYLGNHNLYLNYGTYKTPSSNMEGNIAIGELALSELQEGDENVAIGKYAGAAAERTTNRNVYLGAYAGRMNTEDNRLYIGNSDYASLQEFKDNSLLYGEFDNGIVYINNRLNLGEEIHIGTFNVANTPEGGMVQFVDAGGGLVKPQYYDETQWVDFANGVDTYLTNVTHDGTKFIFEVTDQPNIEVPFVDTHLNVDGILYDVQLNNGSGDLLASSNFKFNTVTNSLILDGIINLVPNDVTDFTESEGNIIYDGEHFYGYTPDGYIQLDNENIPASGKFSVGESIGSGVEIYAGYSTPHKALQFYDIIGGDHIDIADADTFGNIYISLDAQFEGVNLGIVGQPIFDSVLDTPTTITYNFKRLYSSDSSILITDSGNYLNLQAVGAVAPEDLSDGENVGAGEGRIYDEDSGKNGNLLPFRTLTGGDNVTITTDVANRIVTIDIDSLLVDGANLAGGDQGIYQGYTDDGAGNRTLNFYPIEGIDGIQVGLVGDVIQVGLDATYAIPSLEGIILPVSTNADKTLTWSLNYDSDIRDGISYSLEDIAQLNLGSNLVYNPVTNTLDSIAGATGGYITLVEADITRNGDGTVDRDNSSRTIVLTEGSNSYSWVYGVNTGLGWLAFENDYPVSSDTQQGIVQIDITGPLSITNGILSFDGSFSPAEPNYSIQYNDNGVFGGNAGMIYDPINDRIYLDAANAINSGIVFDSALGGNEIYNEKTGVTGDHLFIKGDASTLSSVQLIANKLAIGIEDRVSDNYMTIQDPNLQAKANTLVINDWSGNNALIIDNTSDIYLPQLALSSQDYVVAFNNTTKKLSYAPASAVAGVASISASMYSGVALNNDFTIADQLLSSSTIDLDQADIKLEDGVITDEDFIGFWDVSAGGQRKVTVEDLQIAFAFNWYLDVNDGGSEPIAVGDILNIDNSSSIQVSYNPATKTLVFTTSDVAIEAENSITGDGTTDNKLKLVNDEDAPGNQEYYGTDESGTKGFHPIPVTDINVQDSVTGDGSSNPLKLVNDQDAPGNRYYYGTDSNGNKAWISFCDTVGTCIEENPDIIVIPIDPNTGDVNIAISRSSCDSTFSLIASNFVDSIINLTDIRIDTVPTYGTLEYNGVTVLANDILHVELESFQYNLIYIADSTTGSAYVDNFTFSTKYASNPSYSSVSAKVNVSVDACVTSKVCIGYLYNFYAVDDFRNISSSDSWTIPTQTQINDLITYLGGSSVAGAKLKSDGFTYWDDSGTTSHYGTNDYGFSAKGAGFRTTAGAFASLHQKVNYWSDEVDTTTANALTLDYNSAATTSSTLNKKEAASVRFVSDATGITDGETIQYVGNDGKVYDAIAINELYWMVDDLEEGLFRNNDIITWEGEDGLLTDNEWGIVSYPAWCIYNRDLNNSCNAVFPTPDYNLTTIGYVYNKKTIDSSFNITSSDDWRVPTEAEANALITYIGGTSSAYKLKTPYSANWKYNATPTPATNEYGFNAKGSGHAYMTYSTNAKYQYINEYFFIGLAEANRKLQMHYSSDSVNVITSGLSNDIGYAVPYRFVKTTTDSDGSTTTYTGNDSKTYNAIAINGLYWMTENLEETEYRNGKQIYHLYYPQDLYFHQERTKPDSGCLGVYDNNNEKYAGKGELPTFVTDNDTFVLEWTINNDIYNSTTFGFTNKTYGFVNWGDGTPTRYQSTNSNSSNYKYNNVDGTYITRSDMHHSHFNFGGAGNIYGGPRRVLQWGSLNFTSTSNSLKFNSCINFYEIPTGSIPSTLFDSSLSIIRLGDIFYRTLLVDIPVDLFDDVLATGKFEGASFGWRDCDFQGLSVPEWWDAGQYPQFAAIGNSDYMFYGLINCANFGDIPSNWR